MKLKSADETMDIVAERLIEDGDYQRGDELLVLINGCGSTTLMEMFLLYNRLYEILESKGMHPYEPLIGNMATTQEMAGFSLSLCRANEEIKRLWDFPVNTPYFKKIGAGS